MSNRVVKTYYLTDQYGENQFPTDFVCSTNKRYIEVHPPTIIRMSAKGVPIKAPKDIMFHSDFVQRDAYLDHGICFCNERRTKYKKYEYRGAYDTFNIWFTYRLPYETYQQYMFVEPMDEGGLKIKENDFQGAYKALEEMNKAGKFRNPDEAMEEADKLADELKTLYWTSDGIDILPYSFYTGVCNAYAYIDHIIRKYGDPLPVTVTRTVNEVEQVGNSLNYTEYVAYEDPNINYVVGKITYVAYKLLDPSEYKFFAEFLLTY